MGLELNINASSSTKQLSDLRRELSKVGSDTDKVVKKIDKFSKNMDTLSKSMEKSGNAKTAKIFSDLKKEAEELSKSISNVSRSTIEITKIVDRSDKTFKSASKTAQVYDKNLAHAMGVIESVTQREKKLESQLKETKKSFYDVSIELKKSKKSFDDLTKDVKKTEKELLSAWQSNEKLVQENKKLSSSNDSLRYGFAKTRIELNKSKKELERQSREIVRAGKVNIDLQKKVSRLTFELDKNQKEYKQAYITIKQYEVELRKSERAIDKYRSKIKRLEDRIESMTNKNKKAAYSINGIMKAASTIRNILFLSTMVYGVQRLSNAIIKLGADFEKTMTMVGAVSQTIGKDFTTGGFDQLIQEALRLGETTEYSSNQAAEAMKNLGLAGFNARQIIATVPGVLDLATAGQVDLTTASQLAVQALTAMGLKTADTTKLTENMTRVNDAFIATAMRTNTTVESIAEAFKYVAQSARVTGMQIEDLTNYLGLLGNLGVDASMAGTQLAFAISKQYKAMEALGLNPALASFRDVLEEINKQGWGFNEIYKIFIQRGSRAVLGLKDMLPVLERLEELQRQTGLSAKDLADIYRDTVSINMQKIKSLFENIGINAFRRESIRLNDSLRKFYDTLSNNKEELEKLFSVFVKITAAFIDFGSAIVKYLPKITLFYKENKNMVDALIATSGALLVATGNIKSGLALVSVGIGLAMNELSKNSQVEVIDSKLKSLYATLDKFEKRGFKPLDELEKDLSPGTEISNSIRKQIDDLEKQRKRLQKEISEEANTPEVYKKKFEESLRFRQQLLKDFSTQIAQDIKVSQDASASAFSKMKETQDRLNELVGSENKLKLRKSGKLTFVGDLPLEDQRKKELDKLEEDLKKYSDIREKQIRDLNNYIEQKRVSEEKLALLESSGILASTRNEDIERYESVKSSIQSATSNILNMNDAIKSTVRTIKNIGDVKQVIGAKFDIQIEERDFNRATQAQDKILDAEKKNFDLRKNLYFDFIKYKSSTFEKFIGEELSVQIDAEKRSFEIFKRQQKYLAPEQRLSSSEMTNLESQMKQYFANLETYKTSQVLLGEVERKNAEIDSQKEILQRKYDLISGFSFKVTRDQKASLKEQRDLEVKALQQTIAAQEAIETSRQMNPLISDKMSETQFVEWVSKNKEKVDLLISEWNKKINDTTSYSIQNIIDGFESAVSSSLGNVFSDALKGDLQNASDYFKSFTDSLISMWSQMAAQMVITGQGIAGLGMGASLGVMGAAGVALYGISSVISSRERRKAEEARKAALREQLSDELGDAIAQLELSDTSYEIYQLNERIADLTAQAKDAGYPMAEIIKLRKLETEAILDEVAAKYESIQTNITDWITGIRREDWTIEDWKSEYDRLHNDLLNLDQTSTTYQDDSISTLEDMFDALQNIYEIQKEQLDALKSLDDSLTAQIWDLQNTGNMPTSLAAYQQQYSTLLAATGIGTGTIDTEAVSDFQDFVSSYIDVFSAAGYSYSDLVSQVVGDLGDLQVDVESEMERLTAAIDLNTIGLDDVNSSLSDVEQAIKDLTDITTEIANREIYNVWKELIPDTTYGQASASTLQSIADSATNIYSYNLDRFIGNTTAGQSYSAILDSAQLILDWVNQVDTSISEDLANWVNSVNALDFTPLTIDMIDSDGNGLFTVSEFLSAADEIANNYNDLINLISNIPAYATGGWSNSPSVFGETGYGEWAVPDANNPNNANFLKSVGVDSAEIGRAIGEIVAERLSSQSNGSNGDIVVKINDKEIARATIDYVRRNPETKKYLQ